MSEFAAGPAGRIERVRALMVERGYDAIVVRDEANLRWLTGVKGVFDYTFEFPHAAFITADQCLFHTETEIQDNRVKAAFIRGRIHKYNVRADIQQLCNLLV